MQQICLDDYGFVLKLKDSYPVCKKEEVFRIYRNLKTKSQDCFRQHIECRTNGDQNIPKQNTFP